MGLEISGLRGVECRGEQPRLGRYGPVNREGSRGGVQGVPVARTRCVGSSIGFDRPVPNLQIPVILPRPAVHRHSSQEPHF